MNKGKFKYSKYYIFQYNNTRKLGNTMLNHVNYIHNCVEDHVAYDNNINCRL